ncbi:MAG: hypothetical protein JNM07_01715 [Phycisphaerae bacterium]|nr:hypothetical protein [Phycisphaerae bacterium]
MPHDLDLPRLGPYVIRGELQPGRLGARWLAVNEQPDTAHVLHRLRCPRDAAGQRRLLMAVEAVAALRHAHVLPIESFRIDADIWLCLITPYTGDASGAMTLDRLAALKGGQMDASEVRRLLLQLLSASAFSHAHGLVHGRLGLSEVLVDRRGSVLIELYGLGPRMRGLDHAADGLVRAEVRSIVGQAYQLLTGLMPLTPVVAATRVVRGLDAAWDEFFRAGLDERTGGFGSAARALGAVPERAPEVIVRRSWLRGAIRRVLRG